MEVLFGLVGIIIAIALIFKVMDSIEKMFGKVNWENFFKFLIFGGIGLAVVFSFTAEGVLVIVGAYIVLLVVALISGKFNNEKKI